MNIIRQGFCSTTRAVTLLAVTLLAVGSAHATPIANPDPLVFLDDVDDEGLYAVGQGSVLIELFDAPFLLGLDSELGFYFVGADVTNLAERHRLFSPADANPDPGGPLSVDPVVSIDFAGGLVIDVDEGVVEDSFTPVVGPIPLIGFYYEIEGSTLFTQAVLNGGVDLAATYPFISEPSDLFVLSFIVPEPNVEAGFVYVSFHLLAGIVPIGGTQNVPAPNTLVLTLLLAIVFMRRTRLIIRP